MGSGDNTVGSGDNTLPMAASTASDSLLPGQLFGRYLIVDRVGAGGVGEVYAAYDPSLDRRIALKVMRGGVDDGMASALPQPARCETRPSDPEAMETSQALEEARTERAHVTALLAAGKYAEAVPRSQALLKSANELGAPRFLGEVLFTAGDALYENGQLDAAVDMLERAAFQGVAANAPNLVLRAATVLTVVESNAGHPDAGLRWSRLAGATLEAAGDRDVDRAVHLANRAAAFSGKGDYDAAEAAIRKALEFDDAASERQRVTLLQTLAGVLFYQSRFDEAVELQKQALKELKSTLGPKHPAVGLALFNLGTFSMSQGKFADGDQYLADALGVQEHSFGPNHTDVASTLNSMGASLYQQGEIADAVVALERALQIKTIELAPEHPQVLDATVNLALLVSENGELARGVAMLEDVVRRIEAAEETPVATQSTALFNLGRLQQKQGRIEEAGVLLEKALRLDEERLGKDDPRLAMLLMGLGVLRKTQERPQEALRLYQRALEIQEGKLEPNHPAILAALNNIASTHLVLDAPQKTKDTADRLLAVSEGRDEYIGRASFLLARAHLAVGERTRALRRGRVALEIHRKLPKLAEDVAEVEAFVEGLG